MRLRVISIVLILVVAFVAANGQTVTRYQEPPRDIAAMLENSPFPTADVSPDGHWLLLSFRPPMPSIEDLSQPMLRLAGTRISPATSDRFTTQWITELSVVDLRSRATRDISLPEGARIARVHWSPDSKRIAFTNRASDRLELLIAEPETGVSRRVGDLRLNGTTGTPYKWLPDSAGFICLLVPEKRGAEPSRANIPAGPKILETVNEVAAIATYQDLLSDAHDETLFDHYFTSKLARVDLAGASKQVGSAAIFDEFDVSPDGRFLYVSRVVRPYSYYVPYGRFAQELEVWDWQGKLIKHIASAPLAEKIPIGGVRTGPRSVQWHSEKPSLVYAEALDGGNPKRKVENRDRVFEWDYPFTDGPRELFKTEFRFAEVRWLERGRDYVFREYDRPSRRTRVYLVGADRSAEKPRLLFDYLSEDKYNNPGSFVLTTNRFGSSVIRLSKDDQHIYLKGQGATDKGEYPFIRSYDLENGRAEELFRAEDPFYESVIDVLDAEATLIITSRESAAQPPNFVLRNRMDRSLVTLTRVEDPQPAFRRVKKQLVKYERSDGIGLSGILHLPPDYKPGERRPTFIWAYPIEFASADAASQVGGSANRFTRVSGASHLFLAVRGYVVLDSAAMPIIGGEKANDTFVEQLVKNAAAAIDHLEKLGVTDPDRVGVGGHSYGAFMTANLLAHCDLFRAGIARSGAYNRSLTPFSFQNERRTFWEAPEVYLGMSPFMHANKIDEPILLIHGEADNNSGTFPFQSERLFHALKGLGRTSRLVMLPLESHGYAARESVLHALYEMIRWTDLHVKDAPPRNSEGTR